MRNRARDTRPVWKQEAISHYLSSCGNKNLCGTHTPRVGRGCGTHTRNLRARFKMCGDNHAACPFDSESNVSDGSTRNVLRLMGVLPDGVSWQGEKQSPVGRSGV